MISIPKRLVGFAHVMTITVLLFMIPSNRAESVLQNTGKCRINLDKQQCKDFAQRNRKQISPHSRPGLPKGCVYARHSDSFFYIGKESNSNASDDFMLVCEDGQDNTKINIEQSNDTLVANSGNKKAPEENVRLISQATRNAEKKTPKLEKTTDTNSSNSASQDPPDYITKFDAYQIAVKMLNIENYPKFKEVGKKEAPTGAFYDFKSNIISYTTQNQEIDTAFAVIFELCNAENRTKFQNLDNNNQVLPIEYGYKKAEIEFDSAEKYVEIAKHLLNEDIEISDHAKNAISQINFDNFMKSAHGGPKNSLTSLPTPEMYAMEFFFTKKIRHTQSLKYLVEELKKYVPVNMDAPRKRQDLIENFQHWISNKFPARERPADAFFNAYQDIIDAFSNELNLGSLSSTTAEFKAQFILSNNQKECIEAINKAIKEENKTTEGMQINWEEHKKQMRAQSKYQS